MRLEHIAFNVPDVAALADWYVANLGMQLVRKVDAPPYMTFLADSAGKSMIEVYSNPLGAGINHAENHPTAFHLAFAVDNIESRRDALEAAGASRDGDIDSTPAGDRLAFLRDPWGHVIQLVERRQPMLD